MKNSGTYILLGFITALMISATGWSGLPKKIQGIIFGGNVVIGDTLGIDTGSLYTSHGSVLQIDTTADGRYFFKPATLSLVTDSAYILQSISDTATQLRSELADSVLWRVGGAGNFVRLQDITYTVALGSSSIVSDNSALEVTGPVLFTPTAINSEAATNIDAVNGNIIIISTTGSPNDTIVSIDQAQAGQIIHITNSDISNSVYMSPYAFANTSSQSLDTPGDSNVVIGPKDVVGILCVSDSEFRVISVTGNQ